MVSQLGFWGQYVAVGWEARTLTKSDFLITAAFAAQWFPSLLLSSVAGVLADRYDRRKLVLFGNLAMVAPPVVIGLLIQSHRINMLLLIGFVMLGGVGQTFTQPAAAAYVPALVPPADLHSAIALNAGMTNSTRVIGPTLAGGLIAAWGVAWGFHVNAISFLAVAIACTMVHTRPAPKPRASATVFHELKLGISYSRKNRAVARLIMLLGVEAFFMMHSSLMPIFARDVLHGGVSTYGLLSAAPGIGFVGAAIITTMLTTGRHRRIALTVCSFGLGAAILTLSLSRVLPLSLLALGFFGLFFMTTNTVIMTMLLSATDDEFRGRVMGVFAMVSTGAFPVNSLLAGVLSSWLGAPGTVLMCGICLLLFSVIFFSGGSMTMIREQTEHHAVAAPLAPA